MQNNAQSPFSAQESGGAVPHAVSDGENTGPSSGLTSDKPEFGGPVAGGNSQKSRTELLQAASKHLYEGLLALVEATAMEAAGGGAAKPHDQISHSVPESIVSGLKPVNMVAEKVAPMETARPESGATSAEPSRIEIPEAPQICHSPRHHLNLLRFRGRGFRNLHLQLQLGSQN